MKWKCPHCGDEPAKQIIPSDELSWSVDVKHKKELWCCDECNEYYFAYFKLTKIVALKEGRTTIS